MKKPVLFIIAVLMLTISAFSQITSNGTGGGNWNTAATWSGGVVPNGQTQDVIIQSPDVVTLDATVSVRNVTVQSGASLLSTVNTNVLQIYANGTILQFDGTVGASGLANALVTKFQTGGATYTIKGSGPTTYFYRLYPSGTSGATLDIQKNINVAYSSGAAIYANAKGPFVVTLASGSTLTTEGYIAVGSGSTGADPSSGANMTLNINGTLTMPDNTNINLSNAATFTTALNIGASGVLNLGKSLLAPSTGLATAVTLSVTSGGTINCNGTAAGSIDLSKVSSPTLHHLTINNAAGITLLSPITVNGVLTLSSGLFNNSTNQVTLGPSGSVVNAGGTISQAPLPVELVSFNASVKGKNVELKWNTATEVNNAGFEIERKTNDQWSKIGFVEGNGTTNTPKEYRFVDAVHSGITYSYRLKQIDRDGKFEYSPIVEATTALTAEDYRLTQNYPNPFNPSTTFNFAMKNAEQTTVKVYNLVGQEVATLFNGIADPNQVYTLKFDGKDLSSGIYFYSLRSSTRNEMKKMMLLK